MSGVGEIIAIVSCVAGLIEAIDAGHRIVKQIKERRKAHRADGALPPSDELEQTLKDGKDSIQKLVEKGNKRFGAEFEEGDEIAQIAIMRITIQIQNVLLNRLTQARADDGVVDFAECIDLSDQGVGDALIALQQLYQRKLEKSIPKKQELIAEASDEPERPPPIQSVKTSPPAPLSQRRPKDVRSNTDPVEIKRQEPVRPFTFESKNPSGLRGLFQSKNSDDQRKKRKSTATYSSGFTAPVNIPIPPRRSTTTSLEKSPISNRTSRVSVSSTNSSNPDQSAYKGRGAESQTWSEGMSRAPTLGSMANMEAMTQISSAELAMYGGTCKYACLIREHGPKGNLEAQNNALYGMNWVLQCKSSKCKFGKQARDAKSREQVDNKVYSSHGMQYRWIFLAKSHASQNMASSSWPYVCLICQLLNHDPKKHYGHEELFSHIAEHEEDNVGGTSLEGPLVFSNRGIKTEAEFDLNLPQREPAPRKRPAAQILQPEDELRRKLHEVRIDRNSKASSLESYQTEASSMSAHTDPYANPWA